jgi:hypothetical protein
MTGKGNCKTEIVLTKTTKLGLISLIQNIILVMGELRE